jgi:DNA-directed RNA polymerase subunit K/omega|tara:strand:+ start:9936 stop:10283 length:348 start_codon:yes stop_codon:yes gene_type:complete
MNYKNTNAARTTVTRDLKTIDGKTEGNIYEAIVIMAKRSNQIAKEMKDELTSKLEEFATTQDNLEEIFENREQIEISKFYERLPKPHSIAIQELLEDKIYIRQPEVVEPKETSEK